MVVATTLLVTCGGGDSPDTSTLELDPDDTARVDVDPAGDDGNDLEGEIDTPDGLDSGVDTMLGDAEDDSDTTGDGHVEDITDTDLASDVPSDIHDEDSRVALRRTASSSVEQTVRHSEDFTMAAGVGAAPHRSSSTHWIFEGGRR